MSGRTIGEVVGALEVLAPPRLAASWDNTGLLVSGTRPVRRVFLCVDLTEPVLAEAVGLDVDLIVAYHPPLFQPVRRLDDRTPLGRTLLGAARAGVHVYSPHTALDAAAGGMNDWLLEAFGPLDGVAPLEPDRLEPALGAGRRATLREPAPLPRLVERIGAHLGLPLVRVAAPEDLRDGARPVRSVVVCPGAGGSLFGAAPGADLYLTGELRHHDVLALVAGGSAVVLTDHTHTERGFLPRLGARLVAALPELEVRCSRVDADPLCPVTCGGTPPE